MNTNLLQKLILSTAMALSLSACQKSSDSNSSPAPAEITPVPTEAPVEKPKTALEMKDEAELQLQSVGLKFVDQTEAPDIELHLIEAKWDLTFYREFLTKAEVKPTLESQFQMLKAYCTAVDTYLEQDLAIDPQDLENESVEDLLKLAEQAKYEARLKLAQERLTKVELRLEARQKAAADKEAANKTPASADSDKISAPAESDKK